jgi:hypothetical protein
MKRKVSEITSEVNRLNAEIANLSQSNLDKAIRTGELLTEVKIQVGHGDWRMWIANNLSFSWRTAARYMALFIHKADLKGIKTMREAQALITVHQKEKGLDAIGADYKRIRKELVRPVKLAHRNLRKLSYVGDSPETLDQILAEMLMEAEGIVSDLKEIME